MVPNYFSPRLHLLPAMMMTTTTQVLEYQDHEFIVNGKYDELA
jgi:hypothetical protein